MRFEFQIVDGPSTGRRFYLSPSMEITVGRTEQADQAISSDLIMSSRHFKLQADSTGCRLDDLGSTNGTFVNGQRVQQSALSHGDTITAGATTFELRISLSPDSVPPAVPKPADSAVVQSAPPPRVFKDSSVARTTTDSVPNAAGPSESKSGQRTVFARIEMDGQFGSRSVSIRQGERRVFGRTEHADIVVPDEMISSLHLSLSCEGTTVALQDLGSSNGTFTNGKRVKQAVLKEGDKFVAGQTDFRVAEIRPEHAAGQARPLPPDVTATFPTAPPEPENVEVEAALEPVDEAVVSTSKIPSALHVPAPTPPADEPRIIPTIGSIRSKWPYEKGLTDEDGRVRLGTLLAAVWSRQPWLLDQCRAVAGAPSQHQINELVLLAILGGEHDLPLFQKIGISDHLGAERLRLLGVYGHPRTVPMLLAGIDSEDAKTAYFAAKAFTKITGCEIDSERTAEIADEMGGEPVEVVLPDPSLATNGWKEVESKFSTVTRVCRGIVLDPPPVEEPDIDALDMETRVEIAIREIYLGKQRLTSALLFRALHYLSRDTRD